MPLVSQSDLNYFKVKGKVECKIGISSGTVHYEKETPEITCEMKPPRQGQISNSLRGRQTMRTDGQTENLPSL